MTAPTSVQRMADLLFGTDPRLRVRVRLCFLAAIMYACWIAVLMTGLRSGLDVPPWALHIMLGLHVFAMAAFYPLVRSGRTAHLADPALVLPQIITAYVISAFNYVFLPDSRGALLQVMCLIQVFGLLSLTPREVVVGGLAGAASLAAAWMGGSLFMPAAVFHPSREAMLLSTSGFILILLTLMSHGYSQIRKEVREQKRALGEAVAQVEHIVAHDPLTGLYNRHHMVATLERELARADRSGQPFAVVIIDLDHFKQINDTHGHPAGDEVLESFAGIAQEVLRDTDILGRWGGEEFLILMPDAHPADRARVGLRRLRSVLTSAVMSPAIPALRLGFSAGVAIPCPGETVDGVLERADSALYQAMRQGRGCDVVAT